MSLILGIETATKICSVAITENGVLLAIKEEGGAYSHSEKLNLFIQEVLKSSGKTLQDLDAVAVSKGPGSYTGLRIGVSAAKGLCYALDIPLVSVSTLQAMAKGMAVVLGKKDMLFSPMIDARRMEVYTALFDSGNNEVGSISAKIIDEDSYKNDLEEQKIVFFGDGAEKCIEVLGINGNAMFSDGGFPSAQYINEIAIEKLKNNNVEDVAYFEPFYLKDFVATTPKKLL